MNDPLRMPDLKLRHITTFLRCCEHGSLSRGASHLGLSQPAVTLAIGKLEAAVGACLLHRHAQGVVPTEAGEVFRRRAGRMEDQLTRAMADTVAAHIPKDLAVARSLGRFGLRHARALTAMQAAESLSAASRDTGASPTSLHQALTELQTDLGRSLTLRGESGVVLNAAGQRLAVRSALALNELQQANDELRELEGRMEGRIRVASLPLARTQLLGRIISRLLAQHPQARIEVLDGSYDTLSRALRTGKCDLLIGALRYGTTVDGLHGEVLFDDPYEITARANHPIHAIGRAGLEDLLDFPWVAQHSNTPIRMAFDELFEGAASRPRVDVESSSLVLTRAILLDSDHLAMLSRRQIAIEMQVNLLRAVSLAPEVANRLSARAIGVTTRLDWLPSRLQQAFLEVLREEAKNMRT
ncbi:LysR substrate-binding domain-containing protein [Falsirhodobacter sp. 1013]|uniref:LysR substrate-binding domain-containing protein n=1 Tax=Falsirhodobacter sp. 1013 TaxID=3417566 RepID=UPI003EBEA7F1